MELNGSHAKGADFFEHLILDYRSGGGLLSRLRGNTEKGKSKTEWEEELASVGSGKSARRFRDKLIEYGALQYVGEREDGNGGTDLYELDRDRLLDLFINTDYYQGKAELFVEAAFQEGRVHAKS